MLSYCLKCRKNTGSKNPKVVKTKNGRIMFLLNCAVCDGKKLNFIKEEEATGLLSSLEIKAPSSKFPLVGPPLFKSIKQVNTRYKVNETVNKSLSGGGKFIPEMHTRFT